MNNSPFEVSTEKESIPITKIIGVITIAILFIAILFVLSKIIAINETSDHRNEPIVEGVNILGTDTTLKRNTGEECFSYYADPDPCEEFTVGENLDAGIYTVTITSNYNSNEETNESIINYNDLPMIYFELNLTDYQGFKHDFLSDYYKFHIVDSEPIVLQNVPLLDSSYIRVYDNSKDLDINLQLTAQDTYYEYDNDNPQAGFYTTANSLSKRIYSVDGTSLQERNVEYVPTTYDDYKISEYEDLYYDDSNTFRIDDDSMLVVYDDGIKLK